MSSINFIGGEKGGVGKSVTARVLAQYFIDHSRPFVGFDTDRSHSSFTRFYEGFASPVVVDSFEGLDTVVNGFETNPQQSVIVDLAAQTLAPLSRWIKESDLFDVFAELGVAVNFWHVLDDGKDSTDLLGTLIDTFGDQPNYIVVQNYGRGNDFGLLLGSQSLSKATAHGARVIALPRLHDASMRKIDAQNTSFWKAVNDREGPHALGLLERQRVKTWLATAYAAFDTLPPVSAQRAVLSAGRIGGAAERRARSSTSSSSPKPAKAMNDQLAIDRPRKVQSTCEQSPLPRKIIGSARCSGKVSIIP